MNEDVEGAMENPVAVRRELEFDAGARRVRDVQRAGDERVRHGAGRSDGVDDAADGQARHASRCRSCRRCSSSTPTATSQRHAAAERTDRPRRAAARRAAAAPDGRVDARRIAVDVRRRARTARQPPARRSTLDGPGGGSWTHRARRRRRPRRDHRRRRRRRGGDRPVDRPRLRDLGHAAATLGRTGQDRRATTRTRRRSSTSSTSSD